MRTQVAAAAAGLDVADHPAFALVLQAGVLFERRQRRAQRQREGQPPEERLGRLAALVDAPLLLGQRVVEVGRPASAQEGLVVTHEVQVKVAVQDSIAQREPIAPEQPSPRDWRQAQVNILRNAGELELMDELVGKLKERDPNFTARVS